MHEIMHLLIEWLLVYGGPVLFCLLVLGIVGLPIPDETLLALSGTMMAKGKLALLSTFGFAVAGSIVGITISYYLGKSVGIKLIERYGPKIKITKERFEKATRWYEKVGKWALFMGYFIPIVRHLTGFIAGSLNLSLKEFMPYAYIGAIVWVTTFISLGYFLMVGFN